MHLRPMIRFGYAPRLLMVIAIVASSAGCIQDTYQYGVRGQLGAFTSPNPMVVGGDCPSIDRIESIVQSPRRLVCTVLGRPGSRDVNAQDYYEAVAAAQKFLADNGLNDVYVDLRCYEPRLQWERIKANHRISPLWRYTAGGLDVLLYSLIPRRAFRSDDYSPYSNTLSLNSADPASAVYAAATAKEYRQHLHLGTYAALQRAPIVPLIHHAKASSDALTYAQIQGRHELRDELYPTAYSEMAGALVSNAMFFVPLPADAPFFVSPMVRLAGRATGTAAGHLRVKTRR